MSAFTVREATEADLGGMHALVQELAVFEKEPNAVTADLEHVRVAAVRVRR